MELNGATKHFMAFNGGMRLCRSRVYQGANGCVSRLLGYKIQVSMSFDIKDIEREDGERLTG